MGGDRLMRTSSMAASYELEVGLLFVSIEFMLGRAAKFWTEVGVTASFCCLRGVST